jgi:hypothetical protein
MISRVCPKARIVVIDICREIFEKFVSERKTGLRNELTTIIPIKTR